MSKRFPQYARTNDPAVLAAVRVNLEGRSKHHQDAIQFAKEQGVEDGAYYSGDFAGSRTIRAIGGAQKPTTGQWKKGYGGYGWRPFKKNPLHETIDGIRWNDVEIPGLPSTLMGPGVIYSPRPFEVGDAVYVGLSGQPDELSRGDSDPADGGWEEIKASEYHAAIEAYNEGRS
jgi:hypothetical protein